MFLDNFGSLDPVNIPLMQNNIIKKLGYNQQNGFGQLNIVTGNNYDLISFFDVGLAETENKFSICSSQSNKVMD